MVTTKDKARADDQVKASLPPGVKLLRTLRGHTGGIERIAWSPDGRLLASPSRDKTIRLWDGETGECRRILKGHEDFVTCVAFDPTGRTLATADAGRAVRLWDVTTGDLVKTWRPESVERRFKYEVANLVFAPSGKALLIPGSPVEKWNIAGKSAPTTLGLDAECIAIDPAGRIIAGTIGPGRVTLWNLDNKHAEVDLQPSWDKGYIYGVAFDPTGELLVTAQSDGSIGVWEVASRRQLRALEGHTHVADWAEFSFDGQLLGTKSNDNTFRLWRCDTWAPVATVPELKNNGRPVRGLAFHPRRHILATVGTDPGGQERTRDRVVHIWELDLAALLGQAPANVVTYTSAKIVLVGDSGVGKTGLGWRLAHGEFKEHASTHGQQFWLLNQLGQKRRDGAQCEAVLWDLAGQDDYRLIHALFLDDADLALLLFDPTNSDDPLKGVDFWLKQLKIEKSSTGTPTILVAARCDRGTPRLAKEELKEFCHQRGINAYLPTSAKSDEGISELLLMMKGLIPWNDKPATVTTETFKRVKDFVLGMKENSRRRKVIMTPEDLSHRLAAMDRTWKFSSDEMLTAIGHLANHGYVTRLKTSRGEPRILLAPELLNNLAASFVLEARRNRRGLGSLEEDKLLSDGYMFAELTTLTPAEKNIMIDSAAALFLDHNVCFRETDPLRGNAYYVFPELINLKRPIADDTKPTEDGVAYTVGGAVENVYASMVVLMGYTQTFTRTNQWRNHARYEVGSGQVCGFRLEEERPGELDFVLYFGTDTDPPVKMLFQGLFENFLARRNLTIRRFESVSCSNGHQLNRAVVREQMSRGAEIAFCNRCGLKILLPKADRPIQLTKSQVQEVEANRRTADQRSRLEQVLFRLKKYVAEQKIAPPQCFVSYAWGVPEQERWVEKSLATDLQKAGITVVLDRWENARIGASVPRFVESVAESSHIIVVGTELYRKKYDNDEPMRGFVVAAEGDLIGKRMIGTEAQKESVLPVLLQGTENSAFPRLLHGRVYADFRSDETYFSVLLGLLLSLYRIKPVEPVAVELRESLEG